MLPGPTPTSRTIPYARLAGASSGAAEALEGVSSAAMFDTGRNDGDMMQSGRIGLLRNGDCVAVDEGELAGLPDAAVNVGGVYAMLRDDTMTTTFSSDLPALNPVRPPPA